MSSSQTADAGAADAAAAPTYNHREDRFQPTEVHSPSGLSSSLDKRRKVNGSEFASGGGGGGPPPPPGPYPYHPSAPSQQKHHMPQHGYHYGGGSSPALGNDGSNNHGGAPPPPSSHGYGYAPPPGYPPNHGPPPSSHDPYFSSRGDGGEGYYHDAPPPPHYGGAPPLPPPQQYSDYYGTYPRGGAYPTPRGGGGSGNHQVQFHPQQEDSGHDGQDDEDYDNHLIPSKGRGVLMPPMAKSLSGSGAAASSSAPSIQAAQSRDDEDDDEASIRRRQVLDEVNGGVEGNDEFGIESPESEMDKKNFAEDNNARTPERKHRSDTLELRSSPQREDADIDPSSNGNKGVIGVEGDSLKTDNHFPQMGMVPYGMPPPGPPPGMMHYPPHPHHQYGPPPMMGGPPPPMSPHHHHHHQHFHGYPPPPHPSMTTLHNGQNPHHMPPHHHGGPTPLGSMPHQYHPPYHPQASPQHQHHPGLPGMPPPPVHHGGGPGEFQRPGTPSISTGGDGALDTNTGEMSWSCEFCTLKFTTWEECSAHEGSCPHAAAYHAHHQHQAHLAGYGPPPPGPPHGQHLYPPSHMHHPGVGVMQQHHPHGMMQDNGLLSPSHHHQQHQRSGRVGGRKMGTSSGRPFIMNDDMEYCINIDRPVYILSIHDDGNSLSDRQCYVRSHFVEAFVAEVSDVGARHSRGAQKLNVGQVGLRCAYCATLKPRDRAERAVCYPSSISRIYQTVADMQRFHFENCVAIPPRVLHAYMSLKTTRPRGQGSPQSYWDRSARDIGLVDTGNGIQVSLGLMSCGRRGADVFELQRKSVMTGMLARMDGQATHDVGQGAMIMQGMMQEGHMMHGYHDQQVYQDQQVFSSSSRQHHGGKDILLSSVAVYSPGTGNYLESHGDHNQHGEGHSYVHNKYESPGNEPSTSMPSTCFVTPKESLEAEDDANMLLMLKKSPESPPKNKSSESKPSNDEVLADASAVPAQEESKVPQTDAFVTEVKEEALIHNKTTESPLKNYSGDASNLITPSREECRAIKSEGEVEEDSPDPPEGKTSANN